MKSLLPKLDRIRDCDERAKADRVQEGWNSTKSARAQIVIDVADGKFCHADLRVCRSDSLNRGDGPLKQGIASVTSDSRPEGLHYDD